MEMRRKFLAATIGAALLAGGALGGTLLNASAASTTPAAATSTPGRAAPMGRFLPNTNPAHEAAESPAHAAQEAAGQFPTAP